jgi:hypothetical protein
MKAKLELEAKQRAEEKQRKETSTAWIPLLFEKTDDDLFRYKEFQYASLDLFRTSLQTAFPNPVQR